MLGSHRSDLSEPASDRSGSGTSGKPDRGHRVTLKKRDEFLRAARSQRIHGRSLSLQAFKRPEDDGFGPRFGLTVTKKTGGAVARNRIKRRLRAVLRNAALAPSTGHDYVIVARRDALTIPFAALVADLTRTLDQARTGRMRSRDGRDPAGRKARPEPSR